MNPAGYGTLRRGIDWSAPVSVRRVWPRAEPAGTSAPQREVSSFSDPTSRSEHWSDLEVGPVVPVCDGAEERGPALPCGEVE